MSLRTDAGKIKPGDKAMQTLARLPGPTLESTAVEVPLKRTTQYARPYEVLLRTDNSQMA